MRCVIVSATLLLAACSSDDGPSGSPGGSASTAGKSAAGTDNGGAGGGASGSGAGGKQGSGNGGAGRSSAGTSGEAGGGRPSSGGSDGGIAHGGAPSVDYGDADVPPAKWTNITGTLAGMASECGNMGGVYSSPLVDLLVVGVARQGLWASTDGGATYVQLGTTGDKILNRLSSVAWDPDSSDVFYTSGSYGWESPFTDGVFKTSDRGKSFSGYKALSAIQSHNDSISVDFNDPDRKTMLSGGHEQPDFLFMSTDAGATWTNIRAALPEGLGFCTTALVLDADNLLVGCAASYSGKAGAIVRSSDGGQTWNEVSDKGVQNQPLWAYDGQIYWPSEAGGLLKSDDFGLTFRALPGNLSNRVTPIELPDGRIVSVANKQLTASADSGSTWQTIGDALPFDPYRIDYSPFQRAFYATQWDCTDKVPQDAIERFGYDFER
jgi:hypothetical protein